jgi:copper(I)-binding protein
VRAIELHEHVHTDGVMQMRRVEQFVLPAGETLVMQPGGHHLMLFGLSESFAEGAKITIELMLTTGDNVSIPMSGRAVR